MHAKNLNYMTFSSRVWHKCLLIALLLIVPCLAQAFQGSVLTAGQKYYLFNIYQSKFLGADNKLQAPNIGTPLPFTASSTGFTIGGTLYTATKNEAGYYQLKSGNSFFAFEDKVDDPNNPDDENRAMYVGGGVTCKNSTNDTDRSYWQLISQTEYAEWVAKKKLTVASLNVDGMPKSVKVYNIYNVNLNPDATEGPGATKIGNKLRESGFDVVGVSEDFDYHSELWNAAWNNGTGVHYNAGTHRGKLQDAANAAGVLTKYLGKNPIIDSDGLCFFYRMGIVDQNTVESTESFTQWNDHYGYTDSGADGLIKKGYRFYVVKLADGTEIDLYTMHMDAESSIEDCNARASQLTQIANAIKASNNGRPIVIIGDSNCRYTRDKVKTNLIDALNADLRFTCRDPWIQFGRNNKYPVYPSGSIMASSNGYRTGEVVDKIWYVNNTESNIRLVAETYAQDLSFVDENGSPLCDHKPCVVTFSYHDYDPSIDDVPVNEITEEFVYLRNRMTGRYLKSGGDWGTHTVVGNYPVGITLSEHNGGYSLKTQIGYVTDEGGTPAQTFIDGSENESRSIKTWAMENVDGYAIFCNNGRALTANDPYFFYNNPNFRWVILDTKDVDDKLQQWEIVTKEKMKEELEKANLQNPVNATWLMSNPNFDRNFSTSAWEGQLTDAKRMTSNLANGQNVGNNQDNFVGEVFVNKCNDWGSCNHGQTWDINQTMHNVPNGWYRITCQAFQRVSNSSTTTATIKFYGNKTETDVQLMYSLKEITTTGMGSTKDGNYYYPNSMAEAALYFNKGYYQHDILVHVTDNTLKVGIKKTSNTGKDNTCWCCFDNFQLYYLGSEQPLEGYDMAALDERRNAAYNENETQLTLTGIWRVMNEAELSEKLNGKSPLVIDATNATLVGKPIISLDANTNAVIKVSDANEVANTINVIDIDGICANFVLADKADFAPQQPFSATSISYKRTNTGGYNTVCLPFAVKPGSFADCQVYTYTRTNESSITFTETGEEEIEAGTPLLIYSESGDDWMVSLANQEVIPTTEAEQDGLNGCFLKRTLGEGYYKLNSAGTKFVKSTASSTITPFRFYLKPEDGHAAVAAFALSFGEDEETCLESLLADPKTTVERNYDLSGRRVIHISRPGIYVKDWRKVFKK